MAPARKCKYGGGDEYWIMVREVGEKGAEVESKRQRIELSEDRTKLKACFHEGGNEKNNNTIEHS